ncbi:hypothetical protein OG936_34780 [Streptomyces sp. NBC_00846]|uniref:hypothetical protein n=1 Tax=Streptomyces sp. NBC_00846 TaxID=2975849 RepID=UPI00386588FA|nr:hypothetical protein OG936_34780 [Streptomyces sp. NBC_00846]
MPDLSRWAQALLSVSSVASVVVRDQEVDRRASRGQLHGDESARSEVLDQTERDSLYNWLVYAHH